MSDINFTPYSPPRPVYRGNKNGYTWLQYGDRLPSVGVLQKLLNRTGARLVVDGYFDGFTKAAVTQFQKDHNIMCNGIVQKETWDRLVGQLHLPIVDTIDIFDSIMRSIANKIAASDSNQYAMLGGMSNGVAQAFTNIYSISKNIFLLRIVGHGSHGSMGFSAGIGDLGWTSHHGSINEESMDIRVIFHALMQVRNFSFFGPYGCIQLMGCNTARGEKGKKFIEKLALYLNVPVTGSVFVQQTRAEYPFRYITPSTLFTAFPPPYDSLEEWCRALPDFPSINTY